MNITISPNITDTNPVGSQESMGDNPPRGGSESESEEKKKDSKKQKNPKKQIAEYDTDKVLIHAIYPRKTIIERQAVGKRGEKQIIASNIDFAFIVYI